MKRFFQSVVVRAICALAFGILLIVFNQQITEILVRVCGLVFIIPGIMAIVSYVRSKWPEKRPILNPIVGTGSILFGLVLIIWPALFLQIMMYILGGLLLAVACAQFYILSHISRKITPVHFAYYIVPTLELATALYVGLTSDKESLAGLPLILIGVGFILYALLDLWCIELSRVESKPSPVEIITAEKNEQPKI